MSDPKTQAATVPQLTPGSVCFQTFQRGYGTTSSEDVLIDITLAHPSVLNVLAAAHKCDNTANTSELLGVFKTLCAITKAVRNRSYVIAAALTSESGRLSASISSTLPSNAVLNSFIVFDLLEVVEIVWPAGGIVGDGLPVPDIKSDRERAVLAALAAILLEVGDHPSLTPYSADSYLPDHLIAGAIEALKPYGWPV